MPATPNLDTVIVEPDRGRALVIWRTSLALGRKLSAPEVVLDVARQAGFPDGMVDAGDGSVVIAFYNPEPVFEGRAIRFDLRNGVVLEEWTTRRSPRVTCPLLVEIDGNVRLVLTTATEGMSEEQREKCPNAGDLFWAATTCPTIAAEFVRIRDE